MINLFLAGFSAGISFMCVGRYWTGFLLNFAVCLLNLFLFFAVK